MTTPNWALTFKSYRGSERLYTVYGDRGTLHFTMAALKQANWVIVGTVHEVEESDHP